MKIKTLSAFFSLFVFPLPLFSQWIAAGAAHSLTLCQDSTVWAWGMNNFGQLGDSTNANTNTPVAVKDLTGIVAIAAGGVDHSYVLKNNGTVWGWGNNASGQLGDNTSTNTNIPVQVHGPGNLGFLNGITSVANGHLHQHSLALKNDSTAWTWGLNSYGQLGDGTLIYRLTPVKVNVLTKITSLAAGDVHSMALTSDSSIWSWGGNFYGQLGDSTLLNRLAPVKVKAPKKVIAISAGIYHSLALTKDGTVWAWGSNAYGQLGDGTTSNSSVPVEVNGLTGIVAISGGELHSLALKNDGTVWTWGLNDYGQLGDGTANNKTIPVKVSNLSGVTSITGGRNHSLAMKNDGTVWAWGMNTYGQLGDGTNGGPPCSCSTVPVQVINLCLPTGAEERILHNEVNVFPNPGNGIFQVANNKERILKIEVYSIYGVKIPSLSDTYLNSIVNISSQPEGIYVLRLFTESGILSRKVILAR